MNRQVDLITKIDLYSNDLKMIFIYAAMEKVNKNQFLEQFPTKQRSFIDSYFNSVISRYSYHKNNPYVCIPDTAAVNWK